MATCIRSCFCSLVIFSFIKELAKYEKLSHEVVATEALLEETLFGEQAHAEVILGYLNDVPVAFALFFHNYSTFLARPGIYLEDLFVMPEARGHGIGQKMLAYIAQLAVARKCGRFEWWVLDWNEPAIGFYKKLGYKVVGRTELDGLGKPFPLLQMEFEII